MNTWNLAIGNLKTIAPRQEVKAGGKTGEIMLSLTADPITPTALAAKLDQPPKLVSSLLHQLWMQNRVQRRVVHGAKPAIFGYYRPCQS